LARGLTGLLVPASVGPEAGHEIASRSGCNVVTVLEEPDPHTVGAALPGRHCSPHADLGARRCAFATTPFSASETSVTSVGKEVGGAPTAARSTRAGRVLDGGGGRGDPRFPFDTGFRRTAADAEADAGPLRMLVKWPKTNEQGLWAITPNDLKSLVGRSERPRV
jgi:hypothetical protein